MSEPTYTRLRIGGQLPVNHFPELAELIEDAFSSLDDEPSFTDESREAKAGDTFAGLVSGEVNYGNPEDIIDFCKDHGLRYHASFVAGCEWSGGILTEKGECSATDDGEPVLELARLRHALKEGQSLAEVVEKLAAYDDASFPPSRAD